MKYFIPVMLLVMIASCKPSPLVKNYNITKNILADTAMVVTAHPLATETGLNVLKRGGNAVDAAIAVQFMLAVCYPEAGNIGGGGFMLYRDDKGNTAALDYREMAPARATKDMFLDKEGNVIKDLSLYSHLAAGVPGSVAGMFEAFSRFSRLKDWKVLIQPAIDAAKAGVVLTEREAAAMNEAAKIFNSVNAKPTAFTEKIWVAGDVFRQPELAKTLEMIRDHGKDGFYRGAIAQRISKEMERGKGLITTDDLQNYKPKWRTPMEYFYRGFKVIGMPPPSSGGVALKQLLKSVEPFDLKRLGFQSAETVHLMVEAEKRAYADRATHLGDMDFYPVPIDVITDSNYIVQRMSNFEPTRTIDSKNIGAGKVQLEKEETTHISIVDGFGNAVAVTTTLNGSFGCHVVVDGAGFILNNEMDDFAIKPGHANYYGLVGSEANKIEPKKRMLSSMTPTIIEKDGKLKMVVGTPGGSTIITSVFQTVINVLDFGMTAYEAVAAPRFHHQWLPDSIQIEKNCLRPEVKKSLEQKGHRFKVRSNIGKVEAIVVNKDGLLEGGADWRRDDDAKGY